MEKQSSSSPSWVCTLVTQLSLCAALFVALNIGEPQKPKLHGGSGNRAMDLYFVTVSGGFRSLHHQTPLLKQMEKVVRTYKARFVINLSELGEDDPLLLNAKWYFRSLQVPWYTTRALKGQGADYFVKKIKTPFGKTLDVIMVDTGSIKDRVSGTGNSQLHWLTRTLEASDSNWKIAVGYHSMGACEANIAQMEAKQAMEPLHNILLKHGVDAYLSGEGCANYVNGNLIGKGPYYTSINQKVVLNEEILDGFLLHRVSSLEIVTYLVSLSGEVVQRIGLQQKGKAVM